MIVRFTEVLLLTVSTPAGDVSHSHSRVAGEPSNRFAITDRNRSRRVFPAEVNTVCHLADFNFFTNTNGYPVSLGVASGYGLIVKKISSSNQDKYFNVTLRYTRYTLNDKLVKRCI